MVNTPTLSLVLHVLLVRPVQMVFANSAILVLTLMVSAPLPALSALLVLDVLQLMLLPLLAMLVNSLKLAPFLVLLVPTPMDSQFTKTILVLVLVQSAQLAPLALIPPSLLFPALLELTPRKAKLLALLAKV